MALLCCSLILLVGAAYDEEGILTSSPLSGGGVESEQGHGALIAGG